MDVPTFYELLSDRGQEALREASRLEPREGDFLRHFQALERRFPRDLARAALETAILRREAVAKFPQADRLYFTRQALQQASRYGISRYRAQRYEGLERILDLGCSIGGDTLAFAEVAFPFGIDCDPLRLAMAQANLRALALPGAFLRADLLSPLPVKASSGGWGAFFDPARRTERRRIHSVRGYHPPLDIVRSWLVGIPPLGVKISPGVRLEEISSFDAEVEFISWKGALKEAVLWFGPLKTGRRRATILPGPFTATEGDWPEAVDRLSEPRRFLYEPDPAILRAGLVKNLAAQLDAFQLDADIAYLTADDQRPTPFARAWEIEAWFPFQLKRLRAYLRERGVGRVVVKKRGSPLQPETLIRDLRLKGQAERVVFLTHLRGSPIVVLAFPRGEKGGESPSAA